jgi:hypothetical protein
MKKTFIAIAAAGFGFAAIQGCAVEQGASYETEDLGVSESALSGTGTMTIVNDWGTGFCADVKLTNGLPESTGRWQVIMDLKTTKITSTWNSTLVNGQTGMVTVKPVSYNTTIAPGQSVTFGFCASAPNSYTRPVMRAWNMSTTLYSDCNTMSGVNPTKAALAVAMANELGEIDALKYLTITNGLVALNSAGNTKCDAASHKCKNLKGILGQQVDGATTDQTIFNPTTFKEELKASFERQRNHLINNPAPPAHQLTLVSGPTNIGQVQNGVSKSCGPHYIYKATKNGVNLTSTEANNIRNAMCFFGDNCGGENPYIGFTTAGLSACPSGATCFAIDPTDGDNTSTSTTTAGSAPTYPLNRVWDPGNTLLNTDCITTLAKLGKMGSKCSTQPATCGYLYCIATQ